MNPTTQQKTAIAHDGNAIVEAVAGSGKTTTSVLYAKARPDRRLLYIAYNKSVGEEGVKKFQAAGCHNVRVTTAHSLAYQEYARPHKLEIHPQGQYRVQEILEVCPLSSVPVDYQMAVARHILSFANYFCNSSATDLRSLDYLAVVKDTIAKDIAGRYISIITDEAESLLTQMCYGAIPCTHDAYLKFYALTNPILPYDNIIFDEGQDADANMLDIFLRQPAQKIILGDRAQAIYGFRHAVNSLARVDFPLFPLSSSFRFGENIAALAKAAIRLKKLIGRPDRIDLVGKGGTSEEKSQAFIARSNLHLLGGAIKKIGLGVKKVAFEGNLASYTYMADGSSLFDVLYLYTGDRSRITSPLISSFPDYKALCDYRDLTGDQDLKLVTDIVEKYRRELFSHIRALKERQVAREEADIVFSTVHKAKGLDYDVVELADDFITEEKLSKMLLAASRVGFSRQTRDLDMDQLEEEINALYVAVTRARNRVILPFKISLNHIED